MKNIVVFDIEALTFSFKADKGCLLCVGYKYLNEGKAMVLRRTQFDDPFNDKKLCEQIYPILANAEGWITHNGKHFDVPFLNTRFLLNGLQPLPHTTRHFDTCDVMYHKLKMGNSLKNAIEQFKIPTEKTPLDLRGSLKAALGDKKEMDYIVDHCKRDIVATESLYTTLAPLGAPGWSMKTLVDRPEVCPSCGKSGEIHRRGWNKLVTRKSPRFQCQACGHWFSGKIEKI